MDSAPAADDLTARAAIRNAALRLFGERGFDGVTVRQIAGEAGVSAALVVHHFGSKEGLRAAVDEHAAQAFDAIMEGLGTPELAQLLTSDSPGSLAEAFARGFPPGSPLPGYLRRLLLSNDPAGAALFGRWYRATAGLLDQLAGAGVARPSADPAVRAAFLLVNDLALVLLRNQIATVLGVDPLTPEGVARWGAEVMDVYARGAFQPMTEGGQ